ncbi:hypothetical protein R9X45_14985 [Wukongibacter sp. M2B1]
MSEYHNLKLKICINKIDLDDNELLKDITQIYKDTGYE